jgi:ABC-type phosphate transport system substrate-binding protein
MKIITILALIATMFMSQVQAVEIAVIVNKSNTMTAPDDKMLSMLFLSKKKSFENGNRVVAFDLYEGSEIRDKFYENVIKKSKGQLKSYWSKLIFTGQGKPPEIIGSDEEIMRSVASNESAIAYIDASKVNDTVKVIKKYSY